MQILKPTLRGGGNVKHLAVSLWKDGKMKTRQVHQLVLESFVGPRPPGMWALHGEKGHLDNSVANLYWGNPSRNNGDDKRRDGTVHDRNGEKHNQCKLKEEEVREIYRLAWEGNMKGKEIAEKFGITPQNVSAIKLKKIWQCLWENE